jgi:4-amino-4-deoxy-L-arabinose transferase-like glycosyltransferase
MPTRASSQMTHAPERIDTDGSIGSTDSRPDGHTISLVRKRIKSAIPALLVVVITAYGAILRLDSFVQKYGTLDHPSWARVLTRDIAPLASNLRPTIYRWYPVQPPYEGGDPINYLKFAREMRSFYQAHVREPMFLALTRGFLWALSNQDAAVSFASATGSLLTIVAAYLLGSVVLSRAAGLTVAALLAIEYEIISWAVDGWRDDLFMATVVFSAWSLVRCRRNPTRGNIILVGTMAAGACLTRITALSFVLPALAWFVLDGDAPSRRSRLKAAAAGGLVCVVLLAPYLLNCAIATGNPLYAVDYHTRYYRYGEGRPSEQPMSATAYVASKIAARPITALDTGLTGLFVRPFTIKWTGFVAWLPRSGDALSWLAVAGLIAWVFSINGRMLLVILFSSLVPYSLTWNVAGGGEWRFTMHAYPFYLLAAMYAVGLLWRGVTGLSQKRWDARRVGRKQLAWGAAGAASVALVCAIYVLLPWFVVRETIARQDDVSIEAGDRDAVFFGSGWSQPYVDGPTFRVSQAERASIRLPLPARRTYQIVLRLDPVVPDRQHRAVVLLNRQLLAILSLRWDPERVGAYPLRLPADKVRVGINELTIVPDLMVAAGSAGIRFAGRDPTVLLGVRLWYVRVLASPPVPATGSVPSEALRDVIEVVQTEAEFHQADVAFVARTLEPKSSFEIDVNSADHDHVDFVRLNKLVQLSLAAKHGIPLEPQTSRRGVVVNEPNHLEPFDRMSQEFTENERTSLPGSVNNQSKAGTPSTGIFTDQPE